MDGSIDKSKFDSICQGINIVEELKWMNIKQRCHYFTVVLVYKWLHNLLPSKWWYYSIFWCKQPCHKIHYIFTHLLYLGYLVYLHFLHYKITFEATLFFHWLCLFICNESSLSIPSLPFSSSIFSSPSLILWYDIHKFMHIILLGTVQVTGVAGCRTTNTISGLITFPRGYHQFKPQAVCYRGCLHQWGCM